jgi:predicted phosphodiesterase
MSKGILFIGDIHGRGGWKELAIQAFTNFDEVVLLGDYVDSFKTPPVVQLENLKAIISFLNKKAKGRVTALLGNHDYAYIKGHYGISGFQAAMLPEFQRLFEDNRDIFQIAWGYTGDNGRYTLATHAGLTKTLYNRYILPELGEGGFVHKVTEGVIPEDLHDMLNLLRDKDDIMWKVGTMRGGMGTPGPLWADIHELGEDPYQDINQVVGHTASYSPSMRFIEDNYFIARVDSYDNKELATLSLDL